MVRLFSIRNQIFLNKIKLPETQLNKFLSENWEHLFPQYMFIKSEFPLSGNVRASGSGGRIDILAFNPISSKLVVFELKRDISRNIRDQAGDYRDKIVSNFHEIYLLCTQEYGIELPKYKAIIQDNIETVLISNSFSATDIEKVNNFRNDGITLIKYTWFENQLFLLEYLNNAPNINEQTQFPTEEIISSSANVKNERQNIRENKNKTKSKAAATILKVLINGHTFQDNKAINTFINVIKFLNIDRVRNARISGSSPLIIKQDELKNYDERYYVHLDGQFYVYCYTSTKRKKEILETVSTQLNENIDVKIIPK